MFLTIGHWMTAVYLLVLLHLVPVVVMTVVTVVKVPKSCPANLSSPLYYLVCIPAALVMLAGLAIVFPSAGKYIEVSISYMTLSHDIENYIFPYHYHFLLSWIYFFLQSLTVDNCCKMKRERNVPF